MYSHHTPRLWTSSCIQSPKRIVKEILQFYKYIGICITYLHVHDNILVQQFWTRMTLKTRTILMNIIYYNICTRYESYVLFYLIFMSQTFVK